MLLETDNAIVQVLTQEPYPGYVLNDDGTYNVRAYLQNGDNALYWDGSTLTARTYDALAARLARFDDTTRRLVDLLAGAPENTIILDIGSQVGTQALHLAETHPTAEVLNFEIDPKNAAIGQAAARRFGFEPRIQTFIGDLKSPASRAELASLIKGRPIIAVFSLSYPLYSDDEYAEIFKWMFEVGVIAGIHYEHLGFQSPTFEKIVASLPADWAPFLGTFAKTQQTPYGVLLDGHPDIEIVDFQELTPFFLSKYAHSVLVWRR